MRARTPCAIVGRGQVSHRRLHPAGLGTCPALSLRQSVSSTETVDKSVHKRFTETSQRLSAMGHVALPKNTARRQVADFTTRF